MNDYNGIMHCKSITENCAVWGICINPNHYGLFRRALQMSGVNLPLENVTAATTIYGLQNLQHRGQESSGIVTSDGQEFYTIKGMGLVRKVYKPLSTKSLPGNYAIGHNRYGTHGNRDMSSTQPLEETLEDIRVFYGHNGQFTNYDSERTRLEQEEVDFKTNVDSELALQLLKKTDPNTSLWERVEKAYSMIEGAHSSVLMTHNTLVGYRDKYGIRPLVLAVVGGKGGANRSYILASEDGGIRRLFFHLPDVRIQYSDVKPGEIIQIINEELKRKRVHLSDKLLYCIFEITYLAREDAHIFGVPVAEYRREVGRKLAKEVNIQADYIVPVLDSGLKFAEGYHEQSGIPMRFPDFRDHHIARGFISPYDRRAIARNKCVPITGDLKGKRIIVVDDTEMRGDTTREKSMSFKLAGAKEIHWVYCLPEVCVPCDLGVDFQTEAELIASNLTVPERLANLPKEVKSLNHLSFDGLVESIETVAPGQSKNFDFKCIGH